MADWNVPRPLPQSWPTIVSPHHSTLQWHPAMAPSNGTLQWHPGANNSTLQWHPAMAAWCHVHSPKVGPPSPPPTIAHYNGTLQWHPAMAPCNGTLVPRPPPQSWPTIVSPHHSTLQWHPAMAPRRHVQSAKVVRRPPPSCRCSPYSTFLAKMVLSRSNGASAASAGGASDFSSVLAGARKDEKR